MLQVALCELYCTDPASWDCQLVKYWLRWAVNRFGLEDVNIDSFSLNGVQLMQPSSFAKYIPNDPDNIFWTHLELLRKYKFVGVQVHHLIILFIVTGFCYSVVYQNVLVTFQSSMLWHCLLNNRNGIWSVKCPLPVLHKCSSLGDFIGFPDLTGLYTVSHRKCATLFSIITPVFPGRFLYFLHQ